MAGKSATSGSKKGRRFNRPRSAAAIQRCAARKEERKRLAEQQRKLNIRIREMGGQTRWEVAKEIRYNKRHGL